MLIALLLTAAAADLDGLRADVSDFLTATRPDSDVQWAIQSAELGKIEAEVAATCREQAAVCSQVVYLEGITQLVWSDRLNAAGAMPAARAAAAKGRARLKLVVAKADVEDSVHSLAAATLATRAAIASR